MTRAAGVHLAGAAALAFLTGAFFAPSQGGLLSALASALPSPSQRYLLPQYAAWVFIVVGFGYVTYLDSRSTRTGPLAQELIRFGTTRGLLLRAVRSWILRLALLVVAVLAAAAAGALLRGATLTSDGLLDAAVGFALWLLELLVVAAVLAAVGWWRPRGPAGIVAAMVLIPLGAIGVDPSAHLAILLAVAVAAIAVLFLTLSKKDWTTT